MARVWAYPSASALWRCMGGACGRRASPALAPPSSSPCPASPKLRWLPTHEVTLMIRHNLLLGFLLLGVLGWLAAETIARKPPPSLLSLPLPYGATNIHTFAETSCSSLSCPFLSYSVEMEPEAIITYYDKLLSAEGWHICPSFLESLPGRMCGIWGRSVSDSGPQRIYGYGMELDNSNLFIVVNLGRWENSFRSDPAYVGLSTTRHSGPASLPAIRLLGGITLLALAVLVWQRVRQWREGQ